MREIRAVILLWWSKIIESNYIIEGGGCLSFFKACHKIDKEKPSALEMFFWEQDKTWNFCLVFGVAMVCLGINDICTRRGELKSKSNCHFDIRRKYKFVKILWDKWLVFFNVTFTLIIPKIAASLKVWHHQLVSRHVALWIHGGDTSDSPSNRVYLMKNILYRVVSELWSVVFRKPKVLGWLLWKARWF